MKNKSTIIISILIIVLVMFTLCFKQSFSYVTTTYTQSSNKNMQLDVYVDYSYIVTPTGMSSDLKVLSDEEGLAQADFTYLDIDYTPDDGILGDEIIRINVSKLGNNGATEYEDDGMVLGKIPPKYIKFAVFASDAKKAIRAQLTPVRSMADLPLYSTSATNSTSDNFSEETYTLYEYVAGADSESYFIVKTWIDESINELTCVNTNSDGVNYSVSGTFLPAENVFTLRGQFDETYYNNSVKDFCDVDMAEIKLINPINGDVAQVDENGSFVFENLYEGITYPIFATISCDYMDAGNKEIKIPVTFYHRDENTDYSIEVKEFNFWNKPLIMKDILHNGLTLSQIPYDFTSKTISSGESVSGDNLSCTYSTYDYYNGDDAKSSIVYSNKSDTIDAVVNLELFQTRYNSYLEKSDFYFGATLYNESHMEY